MCAWYVCEGSDGWWWGLGEAGDITGRMLKGEMGKQAHAHTHTGASNEGSAPLRDGYGSTW